MYGLTLGLQVRIPVDQVFSLDAEMLSPVAHNGFLPQTVFSSTGRSDSTPYGLHSGFFLGLTCERHCFYSIH